MFDVELTVEGLTSLKHSLFINSVTSSYLALENLLVDARSLLSSNASVLRTIQM